MTPTESGSSPALRDPAAPGVRRGEAVGLRRSDVNLTEGFLVVRQQVVQLEGQDYVCALCGDHHRPAEDGEWRGTSRRSREAAVALLLLHRVNQDEQKSVLGDAYR